MPYCVVFMDTHLARRLGGVDHSTATTLQFFEQSVNLKLSEGFQLTGGISCVMDANGLATFSQALYK